MSGRQKQNPRKRARTSPVPMIRARNQHLPVDNDILPPQKKRRTHVIKMDNYKFVHDEGFKDSDMWDCLQKLKDMLKVHPLDFGGEFNVVFPNAAKIIKECNITITRFGGVYLENHQNTLHWVIAACRNEETVLDFEELKKYKAAKMKYVEFGCFDGDYADDDANENELLQIKCLTKILDEMQHQGILAKLPEMCECKEFAKGENVIIRMDETNNDDIVIEPALCKGCFVEVWVRLYKCVTETENHNRLVARKLKAIYDTITTK